MKNIHSTAIVNPEAKLGDNFSVGPYAVIEGDVEIGNDCSVGPHTVIYERCKNRKPGKNISRGISC